MIITAVKQFIHVKVMDLVGPLRSKPNYHPLLDVGLTPYDPYPVTSHTPPHNWKLPLTGVSRGEQCAVREICVEPGIGQVVCVVLSSPALLLLLSSL